MSIANERGQVTRTEQSVFALRLAEDDHGIPVLTKLPCALAQHAYEHAAVLFAERNGKAAGDEEALEAAAEMEWASATARGCAAASTIA